MTTSFALATPSPICARRESARTQDYTSFLDKVRIDGQMCLNKAVLSVLESLITVPRIKVPVTAIFANREY